MDMLSRRVEATPDRTALIDSETGRTWSYRELHRLTEQVVSKLTAHGGDEVNRIGTLLSPRPAFVATFHAAVRLGSTVVGLDTNLASRELRVRLERTAPELVVCENETCDLPTEGRANRGDGDTFQLLNVDEWTVTENSTPNTPVGDGPDSTPVGDGPDNGRQRVTREPYPAVPGEQTPLEASESIEDETALVLFTSGTTGEPKAVRLTRGNLTASAEAAAYRLGVSPGDRWLGCLPVYHMGGLAPVVRTVQYGTTLVLQRSFETEATARAIENYEITGISLVPTQLRRLLEQSPTALSSLETVLLGGAPAPSSLLERAREYNVPVYPTYGLTETASQVVTALPEQAASYPGTVGQPLTGVRLRILADGSPVNAGEQGEIVVAGPMVTPGYLDAAATNDAFSEWGLHTGDVGYRDEDGRLWVVGRRDDLVLTGGELVAPEDVAEVIRTHPAVDDAAVVGLADEEWGEQVAALVVAEGVGAEALREYCRDRLASYKLPKTIVWSDSIPRTASGTVDREAVRVTVREEAHGSR